jgi:hypothetical protein
MDQNIKIRVADVKTVMALRHVTGMAVTHCKRFLESATPDLYAKVLLAIQSQAGSRFFHDPVEDDPKFKPLVDAADREADANLKDEKRRIGFCHLFWATKKRILREKFGVAWFTPEEMNPGGHFD